MSEEWVPIVDYEGIYEISNFGGVRSAIKRGNVYKGRILKPKIINGGYHVVELRKNKKSHSFLVHRLVLKAFVGVCPDGKQINHKDGNKTNNNLENLEYVTASENVLHAFRIGLISHVGEKNGNSKLTKENIYEIRRLAADGCSQASIARRFGVTRGHIHKIVYRNRWSHLKEEEEDE